MKRKVNVDLFKLKLTYVTFFHLHHVCIVSYSIRHLTKLTGILTHAHVALFLTLSESFCSSSLREFNHTVIRS